MVGAFEQVSTYLKLPKKTLGKRTQITRTPHGSNKELKDKRSEQVSMIAKILDGMQHQLPTI